MLKYFYNMLCLNFVIGKISSGGRNFLGRVCVIGRGGGHKRLYRLIDYFRRINSYGSVIKIIIDSNRTSKIGLVSYVNGLVSYVILTEKVIVNISKIYSGSFLPIDDFIQNGWSLPLKNMGLFSVLNNIELKPFCGGIIARSAGVGSILIGKTNKIALLKLNSGWQVKVSLNCMATAGFICYPFKGNCGSAGKKRGLGFRPKVRGVAKNPCDHPHGGGNGKKSKPVSPVSAWGHFCKGTPTTKKKKDILKRRSFKNIKM